MADILLIDSEHKYRGLVRLFLESIGCQVREALDVREASPMIGESRPDLAIFGIRLPHDEDKEDLREFQRLGSGIPVIVLFSGELSRKPGYLASLEKPWLINALDQPLHAYKLLAMVKAMLTAPAELLRGGHHFQPERP